jgi:hypothetical protein
MMRGAKAYLELLHEPPLSRAFSIYEVVEKYIIIVANHYP